MSPKTYSTGEAAAEVGITRATLQAWIAAGKFRPPRTQTIGKIRLRLWTASDVDRLREAKKRLYWKGPGRPRKKK